MSIIREVSIAGKTYTFEFQKFAKQANGTVMVSCGGTQVLVTVCAAEKANPDLDFFPLGVDYIEKAYAAGRIPGGYSKREGRPSDLATLQARVIDRPLRPCFPKGFRNETVITATIVSYEHGCSPAPLALIGASTALMVSDIPFNGPVASLRLGLKDGEYIIDPPEGEVTDLDLSIACKPDAVLMVEAGAKFLSEEQMLDAINFAHEAMKPFFDLQMEVQKEFGKEKWAVESVECDKALYDEVVAAARDRMMEDFAISDKKLRNKAIKNTSDAVAGDLASGDADKLKEVKGILSGLKSEIMRSQVLDQGKRIDGRSTTDIRKITCEIDLLGKAHGSSLFTRGETQALGVVTLASSDDQQRSETLWETDVKERFMLHYNFPPFCVGEARMQRNPGRREIGHGALAHRALLPVLPTPQEFSYTIRLVSEVLESNGSSSMATVCAGTMAMFHAGVPVKQPVAGIAMGLIKEGDKYAVLSDILGEEDHLGDMDFKVCGSREGITALQMDIKIDGITKEIMLEALKQAKAGREHILGKMDEAILEPSEVSGKAPRMFKIKIKPEKIRDVIGPGGKNIKKITSSCGVKVDIEDTGIVSIIAPDSTSAQAAKSMVRSFISTPMVGDIFLGKVVKIMDFGVFCELRPGVDGLCHITQYAEERTETLKGVVKEGDEIMVKVIDIDKQNRIKLSRRDALGQRPTYS